MKRLAIYALLGLALWGSVRYAVQAHRECGSLRTEHNALLSGRAALFEELQTYRVRDSLQAASVRALTLRAQELERHMAPLAALVRDMGVKLRRAEAVSQTGTHTQYTIVAPIRDTIINITKINAEMERNAVPKPATDTLRHAQTVHYRDAWLTIDGVIANGVLRGEVLSRDTLTQVVHRIPRRFLFIRWGTKELRQEIVCANPHSRITYSRYIRVQKSPL
ncbi:MAG: hypothetical protein LBU95_06100 [Rikenellaceae bacterium]|jgi:hypothetical protein|nr:hypothetical protein [Rikenellaceae bacterium]